MIFLIKLHGLYEILIWLHSMRNNCRSLEFNKDSETTRNRKSIHGTFMFFQTHQRLTDIRNKFQPRYKWPPLIFHQGIWRVTCPCSISLCTISALLFESSVYSGTRFISGNVNWEKEGNGFAILLNYQWKITAHLWRPFPASFLPSLYFQHLYNYILISRTRNE